MPTHTPPGLTSTAFYYRDTWILAQAAKVLGKADDAAHFAELAEQIKDAFNGEYFDPVAAQYATGSQTANAVALQFELVPADRVAAVAANLVKDIRATIRGISPLALLAPMLWSRSWRNTDTST